MVRFAETASMLRLVLSAALLVLGVVASPETLWDVRVNGLDGRRVDLDGARGRKVALVANVASECGFTASGYAALVELHDRFAGDGLLVLAAPCNQFGRQEPGSSRVIAQFARSQGARFQVLEKMDVNGPLTHELFGFLKGNFEGACEDTGVDCESRAAAGECSDSCAKSCGLCSEYAFRGDVRWNFEYWLVGAHGHVEARWPAGFAVAGPEGQARIREALQDMHADLGHHGEL